MIAVTSPAALWYLTRGTGVVSMLLLTAVVVVGIANVGRWTAGDTPRFVIQRIHRNLSLMVLVFIALHVVTAVLDAFAPIRWLDAVVPFGSAYRAIWLGLGALAFDVLLAVAITSLVRARLGYRAWRAVHWTAYGTWVAVVLHAAGAGSDAGQPWMLALVGLSTVAVLAAVGWRVAAGWTGWDPARVLLVAGAVLVPPALALWMIVGPLRPGWAARAGTPAELLTTNVAQAPATVARLVLPSQASFSGSATVDGATLTTVARTSDADPLSLRIVLDGQSSDAGFLVNSGSVRLAPPEGAAAYRGALLGLDEGTLTARLSDGHGDVIDVQVAMSVGPSGDVAGQLVIGAVQSGGFA